MDRKSILKTIKDRFICLVINNTIKRAENVEVKTKPSSVSGIQLILSASDVFSGDLSFIHFHSGLAIAEFSASML